MNELIPICLHYLLFFLVISCSAVLMFSLTGCASDYYQDNQVTYVGNTIVNTAGYSPPVSTYQPGYYGWGHYQPVYSRYGYMP